MYAAIHYGPANVQLESINPPELRNDGDALLEMIATSICGSDVWKYRAMESVKYPQVLGHEFVGRVLKLGAGVSGFAEGQIVTGSFMVSDGVCSACRRGQTACCESGGFLGLYSGTHQEIVRIPNAQGTLVILPSQSNLQDWFFPLAAGDVLGTAWHGVSQSHLTPESRTLIVGDGPLGLSLVIACAEKGVGSLTMVGSHPDRLQTAVDLGASQALAKEKYEAQKSHLERAFDVVFDAVGTPASFNVALSSLRPGGTLSLLGVPHSVDVNVYGLFSKSVSLISGPASVRPHLQELLSNSHRLDAKVELIFENRTTFSAIPETFQHYSQRKILKPQIVF